MNLISILAILRYMVNVKNTDMSCCGLQRIDSAPIPDSPNEIRLFMVVRNESLRLPYLLKHYFSIGVDRIFIIDNNSQDDASPYLLTQERTHVFQTPQRYIHYWRWMHSLLNRYGVGHWCVIADADEILIYPYWEKLSLRNLCDFLAQQGYTALHSILLDMYPSGPLHKAEYTRGSDPLTVAPYFDADSHYKKYIPFAKQKFYFCGGVRKRIFGFSPVLSKISLFYFESRITLFPGPHFIRGASIADISAAVMHFKYFSDFRERVIEEAGRKEHWNNACQYKAYAKRIMQEQDLNFYYPKSARFIDSDQLVKLGIMKSSARLDTFARPSSS